MEAMICPSCGSTTRVLKTIGGVETTRLIACDSCGKRGRSREKFDEWDGTPLATNSRSTGTRPATNSRSRDGTAAITMQSSREVAPKNGKVASAVTGGVGGGSGSGSDPDLREGDSDARAGAWAARDWYRHFSRFWCDKKGRLSYGAGAVDARAISEFAETLESLHPRERAMAEKAAPALFRSYLNEQGQDLVRAGHPWSWFVVRFNGMLTGVISKQATDMIGDATASDYPEFE